MPKRKGYVWKTPRFTFKRCPKCGENLEGLTFYLELAIGKPRLYQVVDGKSKAVKVKRKRVSKRDRREKE